MKNMVKMLKVKIKSLAQEIRDIRLEERKAKGRRKAKSRRKPDGTKDPNFLVFVGRDDDLRAELRLHRLGDPSRPKDFYLRREQRSALLAYAFLRGKKYRQVEAKTRPEPLFGPDWPRVLAVVSKFGGLPNKPRADCTLDTLKEWASAVVPVPA